MTTFPEVIQFLKDLETKHAMCSLCGSHIRNTRSAVESLEHIESFVNKIESNPRLLNLMRETAKNADKLNLLSLLTRFSFLFDRILRLLKI